MVITDRVFLQSVQLRALPSGKIEVTTLLGVMGDQIPSLPLVKNLAQKATVVLQPSKISRWYSMWASDLFPRLIETTGGNSAPKVRMFGTVVAGTPWQIDVDLHSQFEPLLHDL